MKLRLVARALGALIVVSAGSAAAQVTISPHFMVIVDNSGSMTASTGTATNSCGQPQTRMSDAKCVLQNVVNGYGEATFGLARFRETCDASDSCSGACVTTCGCNCSILDCGSCADSGSGCPA